MVASCSIASNWHQNTSQGKKHALCHNLLTVPTGRDDITDTERELYTLPINLDGLAFPIPPKHPMFSTVAHSE